MVVIQQRYAPAREIRHSGDLTPPKFAC
jgi:hypothetical protein